MVHPADYFDAHLQHWEDGELLFNSCRWPNADQLYGFSAECGLKALMKALGGMPVNTQGRPTNPSHMVHVEQFWSVFATFTKGRVGAQYVPRIPKGTPFADWSHHNRYTHRRHIQRSYVELHRRAAKGIGIVLARAKLQGIGL